MAKMEIHSVLPLCPESEKLRLSEIFVKNESFAFFRGKKAPLFVLYVVAKKISSGLRQDVQPQTGSPFSAHTAFEKSRKII